MPHVKVKDNYQQSAKVFVYKCTKVNKILTAESSNFQVLSVSIKRLFRHSAAYVADLYSSVSLVSDDM